MGTWTDGELRRVDTASELKIASEREDGSMRPYIPIWHTTIGDALYVRSAHGPENGWFRRARRSGLGRISAGGVEKDVTFELADPSIAAELTAALHAKYDRYGPGPVGAITGPDVEQTTLRVMPATERSFDCTVQEIRLPTPRNDLIRVPEREIA